MDHSVSPCFFVISLLFLYCFFSFSFAFLHNRVVLFIYHPIILSPMVISVSAAWSFGLWKVLPSVPYNHLQYAQLNLLFILFTLPFMHFLPFITIDFPIYLIALCFLTPDWLCSSLTSHYHSFVFEEFTFSGKISYFHNAKSILKVVVIHYLNGWINPFKYWSSRC